MYLLMLSNNMTINKKLFGFLVTLDIFYLLVLTFLNDPFKTNYSMMTSSIVGYIMVFILCLLLAISIYISTYKYNKKYALIAFVSMLLSAIFPYNQNGDIFSNLHEIFGYIAFVTINIVTILNIYKFYLIDSSRGKTIAILYIIILFIDVLLYIETSGTVAIEQLILLSSILLINYYLYIYERDTYE